MTKCENDNNKQRWSYSKLTSFENCKYEFFLNYIVNDDDVYLSENNYYAEVGSYVHEILAMILSGKLTPDDASQYYVDNFFDNVFYKTRQSAMDKTFESCAEYFANVDFGWLNNYEILGVEQEVKFKIDQYDFIGYIDLLLRDKRDGRIVIVDHKSSGYPFTLDGKLNYKSKDTFPKYKKQMYLYSHAVKELYGEFPKLLVWNHFKDGGQLAKIEFSENDYADAVKWAVDTIHISEAEEEYAPTMGYFYCTNLCNFRNSCDYVKDKTWK